MSGGGWEGEALKLKRKRKKRKKMKNIFVYNFPKLLDWIPSSRRICAHMCVQFYAILRTSFLFFTYCLPLLVHSLIAHAHAQSFHLSVESRRKKWISLLVWISADPKNAHVYKLSCVHECQNLKSVRTKNKIGTKKN